MPLRTFRTVHPLADNGRMRSTPAKQSSRSGQSTDELEHHRASAARRHEKAAAAASAVGWSAEAAAPAEVLALQRAVGNAAVSKLTEKVPVQRADAQHVMTEEHWKDEAGAGEKSTKGAKRDRELRDKAKKRKSGKWKQGEKRRMDDILGDLGRKLLEDLAKTKSNSRLKLYRSMSAEEAQAILNYFQEGRDALTEQWIMNGAGKSGEYRNAIGAMPIGKHLGDYGQAEEYRQMKGDTHAVMLVFTLKPGAHKRLFSPKYAALGPGRKNEYIRAAHGDSHENAHEAEGTLAGYIGVKSEEKEPYSISLASDRKTGPGPSQLLFQLFVESVNIVGPATQEAAAH